MHFPEDVRQDIKTFWGIPVGQLLKILVPLGLAMLAFIMFFPFPNLLWRTSIAGAILFGVSGSLALRLPRFWQIYKRYRKRQKELIDQPGTHAKESEVLTLQDLTPAEVLHYVEDKTILEWNDGWLSVLFRVDVEPLGFEAAETLRLVQSGLKKALAVSTADELSLHWITDADREYDEAFWESFASEALENILPGGREVTEERLHYYKEISQKFAVRSTYFFRVDADLAKLMRLEMGESDTELKESALARFSAILDNLAEAMAAAKLILIPVDDEEMAWIISRDVAPWNRGRKETGTFYPGAMPGTLGVESEAFEELAELDAAEFEEDVFFAESEEGSARFVTLPPAAVPKPAPREPEVKDSPVTSPALPVEVTAVPPVIHNLAVSGLAMKKPENPFAKGKLSWQAALAKAARIEEKVVPFQRKLSLPQHVVVVFGAKRYVGCTTVAVNMTQPGSLYVNPGRGAEPPAWPGHFTVREVSGEDRVGEIASSAQGFAQVVVDLGVYSEECRDILQAASQLVYVMDNGQSSVRLASEHLEGALREQTVLAINKALPSGLSPGFISQQTGMPVGIVLPFDRGYGENFGLTYPRDAWRVFEHLMIEAEVHAG